MSQKIQEVINDLENKLKMTTSGSLFDDVISILRQINAEKDAEIQLLHNQLYQFSQRLGEVQNALRHPPGP